MIIAVAADTYDIVNNSTRSLLRVESDILQIKGASFVFECCTSLENQCICLVKRYELTIQSSSITVNYILILVIQ